MVARGIAMPSSTVHFEGSQFSERQPKLETNSVTEASKFTRMSLLHKAENPTDQWTPVVAGCVVG